MTKQELKNQVLEYFKSNLLNVTDIISYGLSIKEKFPELKKYKYSWDVRDYNATVPVICSDLEVRGGEHGGNCWGGSAEPYFNADYKTPDVNIDKFLNEHFPSLPFSKYLEIKNKVVIEEWSKCEYYGNRSEGEIALLMVDDLVEALYETN